MTDPERIRPLLGYLGSLVREDSTDRGALAALRRGAGERGGWASGMAPLVEPRLPEDATDREAEAAYRVAALFALHHQGASRPLWFPEHAKGDRWQDRSLGASLRVAAHHDDGSLDGGIEGRFVALLDARGEDLDSHLRSLFTLMKARHADTPVDFGQLFRDLCDWDSAGRPVQRRWAQGFWRGSQAGHATDDEPADEPTDTEGNAR